MNKPLITTIFQVLNSKQGMIFPYFLIYLLVISTIITTGFLHLSFQKEQLLLSQEQLVIQNLITTAIYDFRELAPTITNETNQKHFQYETGQVTINYDTNDEEFVNLHMIVTTNDKNHYEHLTKIVYNKGHDTS